MRRKVKATKEPEELTFWQSYSDMMAALLLVFVLIITFSISLTKSTYEEKQAELEVRNATINEYEEILRQKEAEVEAQKVAINQQQGILEQQQGELERQQGKLEQQQEKLDSIVGIKTEIITRLKDEFKDSQMNIVIDSSTGAISFDSSILFDVNKADLKQAGKAFLNEFFPMYFKTLLSDELKEYVAEVIIEGHTDNQGSYLHNLDLSQRRASAVVKYCLGEKSNMFDPDMLETIRSLVTANGRSYYELIYTEDGKVDLQASRRVEIKFRLREDEMIQEITDILSN